MIAGRVEALYAWRGFTAARARIDAVDTDDPAKVAITLDIEAGAARTVTRRGFVIEPAPDRQVGDLKTAYAVAAGDRADETALGDADRGLGEQLRKNGFPRARVSHRLLHQGDKTFLYVYLTPGPRLVPTFEGNRAFDDEELEEALELGAGGEPNLAELGARLRLFYVKRGFLDVEVRAAERGRPSDAVHFLVFEVRENPQVRVVRRVFPCLTGAELDADEVGGEIDSFLEEELPGAELFNAPDASAVNDTFGPTQGSGGRARPTRLAPEATFAPETYERAMVHVRDLFRARGYLDVIVGPVSVMRATCSRRSPPGVCRPLTPTETVAAVCRADALGLPLAEPEVPEALGCKPDPAHGVECSPVLTLRIPIHPGPRTRLWDLAFDGNRAFTEKELADVAELDLGKPLSSVEVEAARVRLLDRYKNRGYAYAEVRAAVEPSGDHTRARVRFVVTEREAVVIDDFVVIGAVRTSEGLVLRRLALRRGGLFRADLARTSEERIATLGTFSSVAIALEDAEIPERRKRVVITVVEQLPQYLDPRIGFSTGEGIRFGVEYGHRNIAGEAVQLTLRVQLSYLFDFMIIDSQVEQNLKQLEVSERLERRNTATVTFPEIGLGPLISLSIDGVDVRDNQRDFGITKDAIGPTLTYRPTRQLATQLGASLELNDVLLFQGETVEQAIAANDALATLLRVPDGRTFAVAQRLGVSWDRRDNPFSATRGTLLASAVEHVNAFPAGQSRVANEEQQREQQNIESHFLRFTSRVAGYLRLSKKGLALALSVSGGYIVQLEADSLTYPDRLFFLGGVDSVRAFLSDSVVPEDVAQAILDPDPDKPLRIQDVGIRGGDVMVNPRAELRVPLNDTFAVGIFLDAGNVWRDPDALSLFDWRYAAGAGLRLATPIGPLALDYGINLDRRPWEDFGALHFSIGLF
ncbi:MAG: BamA/TamA family outer membrane protein [Polyangiaceae bacterium]